MNNTSELASLFCLCGEAAVGVSCGKIAFMNSAAVRLLGRDCTGMCAETLLPEHLLHTQAGLFVSSALVCGKKATVASTVYDKVRVFLLRVEPEREEGVSVSSVTTAIRMALANMRLATDRMELCTDAYHDDDIAGCLKVLEHNYHQLCRLLLNVSVADAARRGELPLAPCATDVTLLCRSLTEAAAEFAPEGVCIDFEDNGCSCMADVDRELVEQMLLNLLCNSLQHMGERGAIRVGVSARDGKYVVIGVDDNGEGIPAGALPNMFDRWTGPVELAGGVVGAGTGLAVVKAVVERHGGSVVVESREGKGTQVRVSLPIVCGGETARFRNTETPYELSGLENVLTYLSTWLPSKYYGPEFND